MATSSCFYRAIKVEGPVTRLHDGTICVDTAKDVPGGGCATYPSPEAVAGIAVGDCVTMRLAAESAEFSSVEKRPCPSPKPT